METPLAAALSKHHFTISCTILGCWLKCIFLRSRVSWPSRLWCGCWEKILLYTSNANWRFINLDFINIFIHIPHCIFFWVTAKTNLSTMHFQRKALSMTDQFSLPNTQHMISTMATMGFYSRPLLDACSKKIRGNLFYITSVCVYNLNYLTLQFSHFICLLDNLHGIPFNKLLTVLLSCKELHYRDLDLLTATSDYIVSVIDIWTNKQV